jgi:hypothetical protein
MSYYPDAESKAASYAEVIDEQAERIRVLEAELAAKDQQIVLLEELHRSMLFSEAIQFDCMAKSQGAALSAEPAIAALERCNKDLSAIRDRAK